jgi:hypothetical protein
MKVAALVARLARKRLITDENANAIEQALADFVEELEDEAFQRGWECGEDEARFEESLDDIKLGIELLRRNDPCADTYLRRGFRGLGEDV